MTFKTRTVTKRGRRRRTSWQQDTRRNLVLNVAFVMAIVAALAILAGVIFSGWYGDHWAAIMRVNDKSYSMDDVTGRGTVLKALDTVRTQMYSDLRNAGKISESDYSNFTSSLSSQGGPNTRAVNNLSNEALIEDYARSQGITVGDDDVKAQINKDATIAELRHVQVIAVRPAPSDPTAAPTQADIDAAIAKAQGFLDRIKNGAKWDDVAKEADSGFMAGVSGDLGTATKDQFQAGSPALDQALLDAVFSLQVNGFTPPALGQDGIVRFATVTSIVPPTTDSDWESKLQKAGANMDSYHAQARAAALEQKVKDKILAQYASGSITMRHVQEMFFNRRYNSDGTDEVQARFMVFAPGKDPTTASTVKDDDPKWADAKKRADDEVAKLQKDPSQFPALARADSDEKTWSKGGGELPFINKSTWQSLSIGSIPAKDASSQATPVTDDLFKADLKPLQILGPTKTDQGYVVMQFLARRAGPAWRAAAARLRLNDGGDFAQIAREVSDSGDASKGGDLGWVAAYQLDPLLEKAVFGTKVGTVSDTVNETQSDGQGGTTIAATVFFKVLEEQTRTPTAEEAAHLRAVVFDGWFQTQRSNATRDTSDPRLQSLLSAESSSQ